MASRWSQGSLGSAPELSLSGHAADRDRQHERRGRQDDDRDSPGGWPRATGARVLLVDADPQGNVGHALGVRRERTIRDLMLGEASLDEVIARDVRERLDVIPSTPAAFGLEAQLAGAPQRETILSRRLRAARAATTRSSSTARRR